MKTAEKQKTMEEVELKRVVRYRGRERIEYSLIGDERDGRDSYSIRAVSFVGGDEVCRATACDVSSIEDVAERMFTEIYSHMVEPYVLCDVVYDLLP